MATVHVDLQEGFDHDTVVVRLDDADIYNGNDVTTQLLYGLADSTEVEVEPGTVRISIAVETRRLSHTLPLEVDGDVFIGFGLEGGELRTIVSETPFGYG